MRALVPIALLLVAGLWPAGSGAVDSVPVRAWPHDGYGRLVFDWSAPVDYSAEIADGRLVVEFDRPFEVDLDAALELLRDYVAKAQSDPAGRTLRFELSAPFRLRHFVANGSVVVDLIKDGASAKAKAPADALRVRVRAGEHKAYSRLVFDWPGHVDYDVARAGAAVTLTFRRPGQIDLGALQRDPPAAIGGIAQRAGPEGPIVELTMSGSARLRHFRDGTKVVLDVYRETTAEAAPPQRQGAKQGVDENAADQVVAAPQVPVDIVVPPPQPTAEAGTAAAPGAHAANDAPGPPVPLTASIAKAAAEATEAAPPATEPATEPVVRPAAAAVQEAAPARVSDLPPRSLPPVPADVPELAASYEQTEDGGALVFPFDRPAPAAAFRRAGFLWLVFEVPGRVDVAALTKAGAPIIEHIDQIGHRDATILRVVPVAGFNPELSLADNTWRVALRPEILRPKLPLKAKPNETGDGMQRLNIAVDGADGVLRLFDPEVGDELWVVPLPRAGLGVARTHNYIDLRVLATAQGVAAETWSDNLVVRADALGVEVVAPLGLTLSDPADRVAADEYAATSILNERLFEFDAWSRAEQRSFVTAEQELIRRLIEAGDHERNLSRVELARFYFARGLPEDALGVLRNIAREDPALARDPAFVALQGASAYLAGQERGAAADLQDALLDTEPEIGLWRAALAAERQDWAKASPLFDKTGAFITTYPTRLRKRFLFLAAETSVATGDYGRAEFWLENLDNERLTRAERGRTKVLKARLKAKQGELEAAERIWQRAIAGKDTRARAVAGFDRVQALTEAGEMSPEEAIEALEQLRFVWRGDAFEFGVLRRLGELQLVALDVRGGLETLKVAASHFPKESEAADLTGQMRETFHNLYMAGGADELPPVTAIALFNEYRELAPVGSDGDEMIRRLADRLVAVDLLDQAGDLLAHRIEHRLKGTEKARVGARLALLRLLDRKPKASLLGLADSEVPGMPAELKRERNLLAARANAQIGDVDQALAFLASDDTVDADRLRARIFWELNDWPAAAQTLLGLVGDPPEPGDELSDQAGRYVLNLAVALNLAGDQTGLAELRRDFGAAMELTEYAADFRILAATEPNTEDIGANLRRVTVVDDFQAFLASYRERLASNGLSAIH